MIFTELLRYFCNIFPISLLVMASKGEATLERTGLVLIMCLLWQDNYTNNE